MNLLNCPPAARLIPGEMFLSEKQQWFCYSIMSIYYLMERLNLVQLVFYKAYPRPTVILKYEHLRRDKNL